MDFEIGESQQEGRLGGRRAEEGLGAVGHEIGTVAVGEVDGLVVVVEEIAFVGVGGQLQGVGGQPQVGESAAMAGLHGAARLGGSGAFGPREMPLADVVGRVAGLLHHGGQGGGVFREAESISPDAVLAGVLSGEDAGACRGAHRLIGDRVAEQDSARGHLVQVRREVHGVEPHGADAIPAELV